MFELDTLAEHTAVQQTHSPDNASCTPVCSSRRRPDPWHPQMSHLQHHRQIECAAAGAAQQVLSSCTSSHPCSCSLQLQAQQRHSAAEAASTDAGAFVSNRAQPPADDCDCAAPLPRARARCQLCQSPCWLLHVRQWAGSRPIAAAGAVVSRPCLLLFCCCCSGCWQHVQLLVPLMRAASVCPWPVACRSSSRG